MAAGEVARGDAHRHRRQQRREQRHEVEELLGALGRLAHLGAAAAHGLEAHATQITPLDLVLGPLNIGAHRRLARTRRRHGEAVGHAAGRLDQPGGRQVGLVQQHARHEAEEAGAAVRLDDQHTRDLQAGIAEQQRIANLEAQGAEDRRIDPHRAGLGCGGLKLVTRGTLWAAGRLPD